MYDQALETKKKKSLLKLYDYVRHYFYLRILHFSYCISVEDKMEKSLSCGKSGSLRQNRLMAR